MSLFYSTMTGYLELEYVIIADFDKKILLIGGKTNLKVSPIKHELN